jgi:hypothetical protein
MADLHKSIHSSRTVNTPQDPSSVSFNTKQAAPPTGHVYTLRTLSFHSSSGKSAASLSFSTSRCSEKGCVFPTPSPQASKCTYHKRQQEEPVLFRSHQPSRLLLDPARSMPTDDEHDGSRKRDRRRILELLEHFQSEGST